MMNKFSMKLFVFTLSLSSLPLLVSAQEAQPHLDDSKNEISRPEIIGQAFTTNRELQLIRIEKEQAVTGVAGAESARYPDISLSTLITRFSNPLEPDPIQLGQGMEDMLYQLSLTVEQPLFTWGKITNAIKLYETLALAGDARMEQKKQEIGTELTILYYTLTFMNAIQEKLIDQERLAAQMVQISADNYENGFILYVDYLAAQIDARQIKVALAELQEKQSRTLLRIEQLSGIKGLTAKNWEHQAHLSTASSVPKEITKEIKTPAPKLIKLPDVLPRPVDYPLASREEYVQKSQINNPLLHLLGTMEKAAGIEKEIALAQSNLKPEIGLQLEFSFNTSRFPLIENDWYEQGRHNITSTIAIKTSLYDGGRRAAEAAVKSGDIRTREVEYKQAVHMLEITIGEHILKAEIALERLLYHQLKEELKEQNIELKKTRVDLGAANETELIAEKIAKLEEQISYYQECIEYFTHYFTLKNLAGKTPQYHVQ